MDIVRTTSQTLFCSGDTGLPHAPGLPHTPALTPSVPAPAAAGLKFHAASGRQNYAAPGLGGSCRLKLGQCGFPVPCPSHGAEEAPPYPLWNTLEWFSSRGCIPPRRGAGKSSSLGLPAAPRRGARRSRSCGPPSGAAKGGGELRLATAERQREAEHPLHARPRHGRR